MNTSGGELGDIYYTIRDTGGGLVKGVTQFTFDTPGLDEAYYYPNLAQLSGNRVLLVWYRRSDGDVYYAVLDSAGNTVKSATNLSTGSSGRWPDAAQLSNGSIVVAWSGSMRFAVLDNAYNRIAGPTTLSNPVAVTGDAYVSVAADSAGHAVLTWMDYDGYYRPNLYYALVDSNGNILTDPMIFRTSQGTPPYIETSHTGYGNTSFISGEPACKWDLDGDGDVDIDDIMQVASRWRTSCDDPDPDNNLDTPNYESHYDLDEDCDIDIVDIMLVVAHWGDCH